MWSIRLRKKGNVIFSKFLNLEKEKRERILNAAMKEFAQNGFDKASTNEIVKEANISKGLLFHYFNNKKALFIFLYDYALDIFLNEIYQKIDWNEKDILTRLRQITLIKFDIFLRHPELFNFIRVAAVENSKQVKKDIELRVNKLTTSSYAKVYGDIDTTKFKEDIDIKKAISIIIWTMEGLGNSILEKTKMLSVNEFNFDEILAELDHYLELLRNSFYKVKLRSDDNSI